MDKAYLIYKKNYKLLIISTVVIAFFFGMQANTLPLYVLELGGSAADVGIVSGIGSIAALFFRVLAGHFLDKIGRRPIYLLGILFYIAATVGYILVPNKYAVMAFKALSGVGICCVTSSIGAILSDIAPEKLLNALFTITVAQIFGGLVAPTLGIFLAESIGYMWLYVITGAGLIAAFIVSLQIKYEKHAPPSRPVDEAAEKPRGIGRLIEKPALLPSLGMIFFGLAQSSIFGFVASFGKTIGIENIGFFFIIHGLVTLLLRPVLGRFSREIFRNKVFAVGLVFFEVSLVLFLFAQNAFFIGAAAFAFAIGYSSIQPMLNSLALSRASAARKGAANATFYFFWDIGFGFGSVALGAVATGSGYPTIYIIGIISLLILGAIFWRFLAYRKEKAR